MRLMKRDEFIDTTMYGTIFFQATRKSTYLNLKLSVRRVCNPQSRRRSLASTQLAVPAELRSWLPSSRATRKQHLASATFVVLDLKEKTFVSWLLKLDPDLIIRIEWVALNNTYRFEFEGKFDDPNVISMINRYKATFGYN